LLVIGGMADYYEQFKKIGVEVYGISTDSHFVHKVWHETSDVISKVQYLLIGDPTLRLSCNFGVLMEDVGMSLRGTFVINPEGLIKVLEVHDTGIGRDASELLRKVKAAQYVAAHPSEMCPAKWIEGDATLTPSLDLVERYNQLNLRPVRHRLQPIAMKHINNTKESTKC
jgi:peroxiredoxin